MNRVLRVIMAAVILLGVFVFSAAIVVMWP